MNKKVWWCKKEKKKKKGGGGKISLYTVYYKGKKATVYESATAKRYIRE